jgi:hypothetical protein
MTVARDVTSFPMHRGRAAQTQFTLYAQEPLSLSRSNYVFTASREFFEQGDERERSARLDEWRDRTMTWLRGQFGEANVVAAILHRDELTPHIQAMVVPINEKGRLSATDFIDGPAKLRGLYDSYHAAVEDLGLIRGVKGSVAEHQTVRDYYAKIMEPTPAPEIVRRDLEVERPGRLVGNPERWAVEQSERIAERITPTLDAALTNGPVHMTDVLGGRKYFHAVARKDSRSCEHFVVTTG